MKASLNWGNSLLLTYVGFAAFMIGMVVVCIKQDDIFLVDKNYYKEELAYQQKIDQIENTQGLNSPVTFTQGDGDLQIKYPTDAMPEAGSILLFRPSNATLDKTFPTVAYGGVQTISTKGLKSGLWRVKVQWTSAAKKYYAEHELIVD